MQMGHVLQTFAVGMNDAIQILPFASVLYLMSPWFYFLRGM